MIEYLTTSAPTCITAKFSGKLQGAEYRELIGTVGGVIQAHGFADIVLLMQELEFPEWEAIQADIHFGVKDYRNVRRAAFVGDQKWADWFVKLIGPFTRAEERMFPPGRLDEAVQWACSG